MRQLIPILSFLVTNYSAQATLIVQGVSAGSSGFNLSAPDPGCSHVRYASCAQILEGSAQQVYQNLREEKAVGNKLLPILLWGRTSSCESLAENFFEFLEEKLNPISK